jgi:hypothetical protein
MLRRFALTSAVLLAGLTTAAQAQVKLEYKHIEGTTSKVKTASKTHQILSIAGMDIETNSEETVVSSSAVGKRRPDGTLPIEVKIEDLKAQLSLPGGLSLDFDSANPPAKKDDSPIGFVLDIFKAVAGSAYTVTLDKQDKVMGVEGLQKVLDKANDLDPKAAAALKGRLDVERIKDAYEQEHGNLPPILVREGETWERKEVSDIGGGQTLTFQKRYEYQGTVEKDGATLDKIGVKALAVKYDMDANADSPAKVDKSDLHVESSDGTILFDRKLGTVVERKGSTRIKGDMTLTVNGMELPSKLDLSLETGSQLQK